MNQVFYGNIITMNEKQPKVEAMVVEDGKLSFLVSKSDAQAFVDQDTEIVILV